MSATLNCAGPAVPVGVVPVLQTPFSADGAVDLDGFARVVEHVTAAGVDGVMFPGFASEYHKLTDAERDALIDVLLKQTRDNPAITAIISVPDHATKVACTRAAAAVERGADAINVLPPHFLSPPRQEVLGHLKAVLTAAAPAPVIVQYAPAQTGATLTPADFRALAGEHANLAAVKVEANPPGPLISALLDGRPPVPSFVGYAGLLLPDALRRGVIGVQPGCSFIEIYVEIWNRWHTGSAAAAKHLHRALLPYLSYWMQHIELIVQAEKTISMLRGRIDSDLCRAPARRLDSAEQTLVETFLSEFAELLPDLR